MCRTRCVLAMLALCMGLAHSFSWDIVLSRVGRIGKGNGLQFYNNGTLTYLAMPSTRYIRWITYDPVHDRVLFANRFDKNISASSFDIASKKTESFIRKSPNQYIKKFAYDPVTELLFGTIGSSIYSFSLTPGSNNNVNGNLVINLGTDEWARDIAVDSCGGYIYWTTKSYIIDRARFNGTERKVIIDNNNLIRQGFIIEAQKMYWIESQEYNDYDFFIQSADLDGKNRRTLYGESGNIVPELLTVSKDFIYWGESIDTYFFKLPKNSTREMDVKPKQLSMDTTTSFMGIQDIAVNYKIEDQVIETQNCEALISLLPNNYLNVPLDTSLLCVHGTKVSGESLCKCTQGYIGERCDVSICQNYCVRGNCSVSAAGQAICRCNAGYSGERCEFNVCQGYCLNNGVCSLNKTSEPVCQCTQGYTGARCDVSICQHYCVRGDCSVSAVGQPICRCDADYSGDRCEANACFNYCLNNGVCTLNKTSEPVCQCSGGYEGERCDVPVFLNKCVQTVSLLKEVLKTDVTRIAQDKGLKSTCALTVV